MVNFYHRFIPGIAAVLELLTTTLKGGKKTLDTCPGQPIPAQQKGTHHSGAAGAPALNATIALAIDASNTHIGGALHQQVRGSWQPLGFFSRKLQLADLKNSTFDREIIAAVASIRHVRHILE
jgi:hypothetical protein